jgi:non-ribosomal peptide synthetase component E (peptide arylation enzyme)
METPLSPLEFARRARKLYPKRDAVVDGSRRLNYEEFFDRCDRWSAALQTLGVKEGDRVALSRPTLLPSWNRSTPYRRSVPSSSAQLPPDRG